MIYTFYISSVVANLLIVNTL